LDLCARLDAPTRAAARAAAARGERLYALEPVVEGDYAEFGLESWLEGLDVFGHLLGVWTVHGAPLADVRAEASHPGPLALLLLADAEPEEVVSATGLDAARVRAVPPSAWGQP
jgi:hypothetical protein